MAEDVLLNIDEEARLEAVARVPAALLANVAFDRFNRLAMRFWRVEEACVSIIESVNVRNFALNSKSLVPRARSLPADALEHGHRTVFAVSDLQQDPRLATHAAVAGTPYRFFACAPIRDLQREVLGMFCLYGHTPHPFDEEDGVRLQDMADLVMQEIELVQRTNEVTTQKQQVKMENDNLNVEHSIMLMALACFSEGLVMLNDDMRIVYVNEGWAELTGFSRTKTIGKQIDIIAGEETDRETLMRRPSEGEHTTRELRCYRQDGTPFWASVSMSTMREEAELFYFGVVTNITEARNKGIELERMKVSAEVSKQLAEAANANKSKFLTIMSHELRTPLHGVLGCIEVLSHSQLSPEQRKWVTTIQKSCSILVNIINDILNMSKLNVSRAPGKVTLEMAPFNLTGALEEVIEINASIALAKNLELGLYIPASCLVPLVGDRSRIQRIVVNFVGNAIKFTPDGSITVWVEMIASTDEYFKIKFAVRDTGIGISEEKFSQLFKRFSQLDEENAHAQVTVGTGLGLALSKELAELMHGEIGVDSKIGEGSTFWFTARFPRARSNDLSSTTTSEHSERSITSEKTHSHVRTRRRSISPMSSSFANLSSSRRSQPNSVSSHSGLAPLEVAGLRRDILDGASAEEAAAALAHSVVLICHPLKHVCEIIQRYFHESDSIAEVAHSCEDAVLKAPNVLHKRETSRAAKPTGHKHRKRLLFVDENLGAQADIAALCTRVRTELPGVKIVTLSLLDGGNELIVDGSICKPVTRTSLVQGMHALKVNSTVSTHKASGTESNLNLPVPSGLLAHVRVIVCSESPGDCLAVQTALLDAGVVRVDTFTSPDAAVDACTAADEHQPYDVLVWGLAEDALTALQAVRTYEVQGGLRITPIVGIVSDGTTPAPSPTAAELKISDFINLPASKAQVARLIKSVAPLGGEMSLSVSDPGPGCNDNANMGRIRGNSEPSSKSRTSKLGSRPREPGAISESDSGSGSAVSSGSSRHSLSRRTSDDEVNRKNLAATQAAPVSNRPVSPTRWAIQPRQPLAETRVDMESTHLAPHSRPKPLSRSNSLPLSGGTVPVCLAIDAPLTRLLLCQVLDSFDGVTTATYSTHEVIAACRTVALDSSSSDHEPPESAAATERGAEALSRTVAALGGSSRKPPPHPMRKISPRNLSATTAAATTVAARRTLTSTPETLTATLAGVSRPQGSAAEQSAVFCAPLYAAIFVDGDVSAAVGIVNGIFNMLRAATGSGEGLSRRIVALVTSDMRSNALAAEGKCTVLRVPYERPALHRIVKRAVAVAGLAKEPESEMSALERTSLGRSRSNMSSLSVRRQHAAVSAPSTPPVTANSMPNSPTPGPNAHIAALIVDDNEINLMMLIAFLEALGITNIETAMNGQVAAEKFYVAAGMGTPFTVVMMDCLMPVCDGYESALRIRAFEKEHGLHPTPIVAVTANNSESDKEKCFRHGMSAYLGKPYDVTMLTAVLCSLKLAGGFVPPTL